MCGYGCIKYILNTTYNKNQFILVTRIASTMDFAFIDLQGFIYNYKNVFAVKEICILTKNIRFHEFVKPPIPFTELSDHFKKQAKWLEKYHHGLSWNMGYITFHELRETILPILDGKILFVKGANKVKWMKYILDNQQIICINVEDLSCDLQLNKQIIHDEFTCTKHKFVNSRCAKSNAALLKKWFYSLEKIPDLPANVSSKLNEMRHI